MEVALEILAFVLVLQPDNLTIEISCWAVLATVWLIYCPRV
jgi:hypothetical protein